MILKNLQYGQIQDLKYDHLNFKVVSDPLGVNLINLQAIDGLIIKSEDAKTIRQVLFQLRSKDETSIYLLPVFLDSKKMFKKMGNEIDGYIMEDKNPLISQLTQDILNNVSVINNDVSEISDFTEKTVTKALIYTITRGKEIKPYRDRHSSIGYHFPFISALASKKDYIEIINKLNYFSGRSFLTPKLLDKVNLCHTCLSSYLNFHETCSKCSSIDLHYENLIHHFRCAYIGPESDFKQEDNLVCPKCDKTLNHIGIDYDKPSEIANCNHCNHSSQETNMKASCVDCGEHNDIHQLNSLEIKSYEISSLGENWLKNRKNTIEVDPANLSDLRVVPPSIFNLLLEQEKERVKSRKKASSFVAKIFMKEEVYHHLNAKSREKLKNEIILIVKKYLRKIDILCAHSTSQFHFLFPDISQADAFTFYETILDNLNKILSDNLTGPKELVSGEMNKI